MRNLITIPRFHKQDNFKEYKLRWLFRPEINAIRADMFTSDERASGWRPNFGG